MMSEETINKLLACETIEEFDEMASVVFKGRKRIYLSEYPDVIQQHLGVLYQRMNEVNGGIISDPRELFRKYGKISLSMRFESFILRFFDKVNVYLNHLIKARSPK